MNQSLQGPNIMLVDVSENLLAFREKLKLWKRKIEPQKTALFPAFGQFLEDMEEVCFGDVQLVMKNHLASLMQEFDLIISKKAKELEWVRYPFAFDVDTLPESCQALSRFQEEFIDVQCDSLFRNASKKENLGEFWKKIKNEEYCWYAHSKSSSAICYYLLV